MKLNIDGKVRELKVAFTEVIFDGTDLPFEEALDLFLKKPEHAWVRILAKMPDTRSALFIFGVDNIQDGDEVVIPDGYKEHLPLRYKWEGGSMRPAMQDDIEKWDAAKTEDDA